MTRFCIHELL